ncbi:eukaryotic translation initiation factor 2-alpha kinase [Aureococcus anophagefferens]|nr:eukaryotic translation initiation factor 2-alpha kinase [Aureococcus anophagefferens]
MYSLGIVAFEVAHAPWDTAMERVEHIQALRRADRPAAAALGAFAGGRDATVAALVVARAPGPGRAAGAAALLEGPAAARARGARAALLDATGALRTRSAAGARRGRVFDAPTPEVGPGL